MNILVTRSFAVLTLPASLCFPSLEPCYTPPVLPTDRNVDFGTCSADALAGGLISGKTCNIKCAANHINVNEAISDSTYTCQFGELVAPPLESLLSCSYLCSAFECPSKYSDRVDPQSPLTCTSNNGLPGADCISQYVLRAKAYNRIYITSHIIICDP